MTTIITNDKFVDMIIDKINKQRLDERPALDSIRLVINAFIDSMRCVICLSGFNEAESFVIASGLDPLTITRLIEKIRERFFLHETEFGDKVAAFRFTNLIGNVKISFNIRPKDFKNVNNEFLNIKLLLKQYYKNELDDTYNLPVSSDSIEVDINAMDKVELLALFSELGEDELRNLINFLPPERLKMIYRTAFLRDSSQGRK